MKRKLLCILLTLTMVFTMMPATAFAEVSNEPIAQIDEVQTRDIELAQDVSGPGTVDNPWLIGSVEAGNLMAWIDSGVLNIAGFGDMMNFTQGTQPWTATDITSISFNTIAGKMTSIGDNAFNGCSNLVTVNQIPATVTSIGDYAFAGCSSLSKIIIKSTTPAHIGTGVFESNTKVIVPKDAFNTYATVWATYAGNITREYSISRATTTGGSFEGLSSSACESDTVSFVLIIGNIYNLSEGYPIVSYNASGSKVDLTKGPQTVEDNGVIRIQYSFIMPATDVTVTAKFTKKESTAPDGNVCRIGNTKYKTLKAAVKKVRNKQTITLLSDTTAELISIRRKVTFTIDSNGFENHATIIGGTGYKVTPTTEGKKTTYKVSCQLIDSELAGRILNKVLNAAEPAIRVIMYIARLFSR